MVGALAFAPLSAQQAPVIRVFHIRETAGIRRTTYPVTVTFQLPKGALADAQHARVMTNSAEVAAQFTARAPWEDGSVQTLDVDFAPNLDPEEDRRYELQFGPSVTPAAEVARGLTVVDQPDAIIVGNLKFSKSGSPQLASVSYRGEGIASTGQNGLTVTDTNGRRLDLSKAQGARLEVVKGGPLMVMLHYTAALPIDETTSVPVDLLLEMPSTKSWLKTTATVIDRFRKLKDIAIERPVRVVRIPGAVGFRHRHRQPTAYSRRRQTTSSSRRPPRRADRPAGRSRPDRPTSAGRSRCRQARGTRSPRGWGHLQDAKAAVAFAFARFGRDAGTYSIALSGGGQATSGSLPRARRASRRSCCTSISSPRPWQIGAATNAAAMLTPPTVLVER